MAKPKDGYLNPLLIDDRAGSADLKPLLKKIIDRGVKLKLTRLDSADAAWEGWGMGNKLINYGVEVKHLDDVLACMMNGRFVSQLRRMAKKYDQYWLLVVDQFRATKTGDLELLKRFGKRIKFERWMEPYSSRKNKVSYRGLVGWLTTMELPGQCHLWHVSTNEQAAHWIWAKYYWSQKRDEQHKSLNVFDTSRPAPRRDKRGVRFLGKPNEVARVANVLVDGIGWEKAKALGMAFNSVDEFMQASERALLIKGHVGKELAARIVAARGRRIRK